MLVAESPAFLRSLSHFLEHFEGITVRGLASEGENAAWLATEIRPRVVIVDQGEPGQESGRSTVARVKRAVPDTCIIFVSHDEHECAAAKALGASECIERDRLSLGLIPLIRRLLNLEHAPRLTLERQHDQAA